MGTEDLLLERRVGGFGIRGNALQPEQERMPVNQENDFQRDQRIFEREPEQAGVVQGGASAGQRAQKNLLRTVALINPQVEFFAGNAQFEIETQIQA